MPQQNVLIEAQRNFHAIMYEHYNQMIVQRVPSDIDGIIFRTIQRDMHEQQFLALLPIETIADQIGLIQIGITHGAA